MPVIGVSIAIPEPWGCELQRARLSYGDEQARGIPTHVTVLPPTEVDDAAMDGIHEHLLRGADRRLEQAPLHLFLYRLERHDPPRLLRLRHVVHHPLPRQCLRARRILEREHAVIADRPRQ